MNLRVTISRLLFYPIKAISRIGNPEPRLDWQTFKDVQQIIKPGDCLLSKEYWRLSNLFIPGMWSHAAIYLGKDWVLEAVPDKVRLVHLSHFVLTKDAIAIRSPRFKIHKRNELVNIGSKYNGQFYDFEFLSNNGAWFCSELVFQIYKETCQQLPFVPKITWGIETTTPQDFWAANSKFLTTYTEIG